MLFEDIKVIPSQKLIENGLESIFGIYLKEKIIERNFSKILS